MQSHNFNNYARCNKYRCNRCNEYHVNYQQYTPKYEHFVCLNCSNHNCEGRIHKPWCSHYNTQCHNMVCQHNKKKICNCSLSNVLTNDNNAGEKTINMNNNKIINLGVATNDNDAVTLTQTKNLIQQNCTNCPNKTPVTELLWFKDTTDSFSPKILLSKVLDNNNCYTLIMVAGYTAQNINNLETGNYYSIYNIKVENNICEIKNIVIKTESSDIDNVLIYLDFDGINLYVKINGHNNYNIKATGTLEIWSHNF